MPRRGQLKRSRTLPGVKLAAAVAVMVAVAAVNAIAISPAHAQASEAWPSFSDTLDDRDAQRIVIVYAEPPPLSVLTSNNAVSAPLPQAVVTGLFMLGGNWVLTRMWKKRKI